jgi:SAM-dependent methyltransferase
MTLDEIKKLIDNIGAGPYRDGSSVKRGRLYHAIPFDEFCGYKVHKNSSEMEYSHIVGDIGKFLGKTVLDVGCANGYFSFNAAMDGASMVTGYEADPAVCAVNVAVAEYKGIKNVQFINEAFSLETACNMQAHDIVLMLNVHMWLHKQLGPTETAKIMQDLGKKCKTMYFQTAHAWSKGMYTVKELKTKEDLVGYLKGCGFSVVRLIGQNHKWSGRFLFACST